VSGCPAPKYKLLVLDELNTGRGAPDELIALADTVTEMRMVKHAYDAGVQAQRGIEF
jgi:cob(I)alamin adenosyltransferase